MPSRTHPSHKLRPDHPYSKYPHLNEVVERNVQKIIELRQQAEAARTFQERMADGLTRFSGSMPFVFFHAVWFSIWIGVNAGWTPVRPFDPFPFGLLTLIVSLEAIFLSTFVLISQNRQAIISDQRADLDLHTDLLAEHEITRILKLVDAIADHLGIEEGNDPEIEELKQDMKPEQVLKEIDQTERAIRNSTSK